MPSVIKVDQIQSDTGTVNLTSNVAFSGSASTMQIGNALYLANTNNFALQFQPDVAGRFRIASSVSSFGDNNPFLIERPTSAGVQNDAITIRSGGVVDLGKGQLKFPASQNASADANTLDDYEEGTWTPELNFNGGTTGITYSQRQGQYVKIGRQVTAWFFFLLSNKGSSTGLARIASFPFTASNPVAEYALPIYLYSGFSSVTSSTAIAYMDATTIFEIRPATTTANLNDTNFTNTSYFWGTAVYQTAT